jgi:O-antigen ligase
MMVATVFSFWKGGSFPVMTGFLRTVFPIVIIVPALVVSKSHIKTVFNLIGFAAALTVVLGGLSDNFDTGRMSVGMQGSEIQDSNDYAAHLLLLVPALVYWAFRPGRMVLYKIAGVGLLALYLRQILSSGSRGGLVSIIVTAAYLVFTGTTKIRATILVGVPLLVLAAIPFVPGSSLIRLESVFSSSAAAQDESALESREARVALLKESIKITLHRPLTGVGPGEFEDYQGKSAHDRGERGMWHVTHNTYTEVSSECGIPALIFFVGAIVLTFKNLRSVVKSGDPDLTPIARAITVMLVSYTVCIFFLSQSYSFKLILLSALAVSMKLCVRQRAAVPAPDAQRMQPVIEPVTV